MRHILGFFILILLSLPFNAFPETKEIISEGTYNMGDGETPTVAESRALLQAKRIAIEQAGTYIESYSKVKNFQLTGDEIQVLASGVMEVTILNKKRTVVGDGLNFWIKISARVSSDKIDVMANRVKERMIVEDYKRLQTDFEKSKNEIDDLKKQLKGAKSGTERRQVATKITDEERLFQARTWAEKGDNHGLNQEYDKKIDAYTRAIVLDPRNPLYYFSRGGAYWLKGQLDKALEDINKAIALAPNWWRNDVTNKVMGKRAPEPQEEGKDLFPDVALPPDVTDYINMLYSTFYSLRGLVYYDKGQYQRAMEDLNKSIALYPNNSPDYIWRGRIYNLRGEYDRAIEDFNKAIAINQNDEHAYWGRGESYRLKGDLDKALVEFNKVIAINPNSYSAYASRGQTYAIKGTYDKEIEDYNKAIAINPNYAYAYKLRGNFYGLKKELDRAFEDYSKAIFLNPNDALSYVWRGSIYAQKGQNDRAFYDLNQAITIDPKSGKAYLYRGALYSDMGQNDNAISNLKTACELGEEIGCEQLRKTYGITARNPDASRKEAFLLLKNGLDYYKKKQFDRAIQEFTKAINLEPRYTTAYYNRGCAYLGKGDHEKAIEDFSIAIAIDSSYANAYYNRGLAYERRNQTERAKGDFQKACAFKDEDGCRKVKMLSGGSVPQGPQGGDLFPDVALPIDKSSATGISGQ
jgi:tetratricopeptide (TPR) repeat protein